MLLHLICRLPYLITSSSVIICDDDDDLPEESISYSNIFEYNKNVIPLSEANLTFFTRFMNGPEYDSDASLSEDVSPLTSLNLENFDNDFLDIFMNAPEYDSVNSTSSDMLLPIVIVIYLYSYQLYQVQVIHQSHLLTIQRMLEIQVMKQPVIPEDVQFTDILTSEVPLDLILSIVKFIRYIFNKLCKKVKPYIISIFTLLVIEESFQKNTDFIIKAKNNPKLEPLPDIEDTLIKYIRNKFKEFGINIVDISDDKLKKYIIELLNSNESNQQKYY
jgi:hypothetical protein